MKPTQTLTKYQQFFFDNAGYSYDPKTETPEQGRTRCAVSLAAAEDAFIEAYRAGRADIEWVDDSIGAIDARADYNEFNTCECASVVIDGLHVASLGAILDADSEYRRVIRAELASECLDMLRQVSTE